MTIQILQQSFATLGLPEKLFFDNDVTFTIFEFQVFLKQGGLAQQRTVMYHPSSNGLAKFNE